MIYDLVVIGGGSGGLTAVSFAAQLGAKVALVEKEKIGGDCTWTGCVPSKSLIHLANQAHRAKMSNQFRTAPAALAQTDMKAVKAYIHQVIDDIYQHETPEKVAEQGVEVILGMAQFVDANRIEVNRRQLEAKNFLIATGARPFFPPIDGLDTVPYHTYETVFDNERLPNRLLVLGAGAIGMELGQAYGRLGANVTIIDGAAPLEAMGKLASETVQAVLAREGVQFVRGFATAVRQEADEIVVELDGNSVRGDMLLVATGRKPTVHGLGLDKAGVAHSDDGIQVNDKLQTNVSHIYAAGDCTGGAQSTHYAGWQAFQAARNALLPSADKGVRHGVVTTVFTDPEVAQVGYTAADAKKQHGEKALISRRPLSLVDRAVTERAEDGFIEVVFLENGRILGATIVAPRAGEMINEFALAIQNNLSIRDIANAIHAYPSYGMGIQRMAAQLATQQFLNSTTGKLIKRVAGF